MIGIKSFGAYIPRLRLQREAIGRANAWFDPSLTALAGGERSICNWDEDTITMAVEAARDAMDAAARDAVDALFLASTTHPFLDRQNSVIVAEALNLKPALHTMDVAGSQRAAKAPTRTRSRCEQSVSSRPGIAWFLPCGRTRGSAPSMRSESRRSL